MFSGHPKGLYALALANTGERFGYYTMLAVFALFLRANFGLEAGTAGAIYSTFLGLVYFMPLLGGIMADKFGFGKMVTIGISIMFVGYLLLSIPLGSDLIALIAMLAALVFISVGTGLFKGNLQVMVGNLYDDPKYAAKRDSGFSLFYMAINIGALFAPTAAVKIKEWAEVSLGFSSNDAYHFSFAVACASLILSILIYYVCRPMFRHVEGGKKDAKATVAVEDNLTPAETKQRVVALCLVFAVVIFFWMAFHQNGLTLTYFADEFTERTSTGIGSMAFDVLNLVAIIIGVYAAFSVAQSTSKKGKAIAAVIVVAVTAYLIYKAKTISGEVAVSAPIFQQFNPFYVVALTPVSIAIFGALAKRGKEPSAPRKIAYGMLVASVGFVIMAIGSNGLNTPNEQQYVLAANQAKEYALKLNAAPADEVATIEKGMQEYFDALNADSKEAFEVVFAGYRDVKVADINATTDSTTYAAVQEAIADSTATAATIQDADIAWTTAAPSEESKAAADAVLADCAPATFVSAYWLILTYLVLTFAELLLSPMGISFVSKVAPPKLKGMMMGGWFVATAIGNFLVSVGGFLWAGIPLTMVWGVFVVLCLLSALFMFVMMKRLESATK
ncbi:MAG: peptide MFS transporter [Rikenellaceae bacterium]|nr:peptide MFS transporter [Rikenellaceae bacterium]